MSRSFDVSHARWRTSSYSGGGNQCVEVAGNLAGTVAVRDSKNRDGGVHVIGGPAWRTFISSLKHDRF